MSRQSSSGAKNVLGTPLMSCSESPMTGFYRNGCCDTGSGDMGVHTVCVKVTEEFLEYSRRQGNDLITPIPEYNFPGLNPGDRWCLCAPRWKEAFEAGRAPGVVLEATHIATLEFVSLEELQQHAIAVE
ncbi:DUF2237 family protein [Rubinisphaera margarita]|uniref:DUF2237 family protein n=1 Tax=Rubinisphaera margarita TaxID=2909586 RepID=UPI001EE8DC88|nr:DUF2237 domain-containing protein [Rubinisphaera margarita]MCG6155079.1 DUF2237 domain-containing protein [Rubinisphaera margarita]